MAQIVKHLPAMRETWVQSLGREDPLEKEMATHSPVVMYGRESWTVKKAERRRIDAFELWCWRRLLRVPWTERRANQSNATGNQS